MRVLVLASILACSSTYPSPLGFSDAVAGRECVASIWRGDERWRLCRYAGEPEHWCCVSADTGEERACRLHEQSTIDACREEP